MNRAASQNESSYVSKKGDPLCIQNLSMLTISSNHYGPFCIPGFNYPSLKKDGPFCIPGYILAFRQSNNLKIWSILHPKMNNPAFLNDDPFCIPHLAIISIKKCDSWCIPDLHRPCCFFPNDDPCCSPKPIILFMKKQVGMSSILHPFSERFVRSTSQNGSRGSLGNHGCPMIPPMFPELTKWTKDA